MKQNQIRAKVIKKQQVAELQIHQRQALTVMKQKRNHLRLQNHQERFMLL
jgi:hypothetical protein